MVNIEAARRQIQSSVPNTKGLNDVLNGIVRLPPHPSWEIPERMDWAADPFQDQNWRCQLHMLRWIEPLRAAGTAGDETAARAWIDIVCDWIESNPVPTVATSKESDAWHDMVEAVRLVQIVQGLPMVAEQFPSKLDLLTRSIEDHGEWLSDPAHIARWNHALHQHEGLLVCGIVLENQDWLSLALERLSALYDDHWDAEGINAEGAVAYHRNNYLWWRRAIWRIQQSGIPVPLNMTSLDETPIELAHATRPDGIFTPIGDTDVARATNIEHPACQYVTTNGGEGAPPTDTVRLYQDGYLFGRSGWGEFERDMSEETFFSMLFGRLKPHGHEDGGSITFSAQDINWVTDPGKYSYTHSDPMRQYVKAHESHSLLYLKGLRRNSKIPVKMVSSSVNSSVVDVTVVDKGYPSSTLRRRLLYSRTGEYLVIVDSVRSDKDVVGVQRWQLGQDVAAEHRGSSVLLSAREKKAVLFSSGTKPTETNIHVADSSSCTGLIAADWKVKAEAPVVELHKEGKAFRFITVLAAGHRGAPTVKTIRGLSKGQFGLIVDNGNVSEQIVFGARTSKTYDANTSVDQINADLSEKLHDDHSEELHESDQRSINSTGHRDPETRQAAFDLSSNHRALAWSADSNDLPGLAESFHSRAEGLRLSQTFDLGLAACAADLDPGSFPGVYGARGTRGPLVNWTDDETWRPTFYDMPVITHRGPIDGKRVPGETAIHTSDLGPLVLPMVVAPDPGRVLTVMFQGALDRNKTQIPIFQRLRFQRTLETGPTMTVADPTLDLSSTLRLGWYLGTEAIDLPSVIAENVENVARSLKVDSVLLQGSSGGGFAALQVGSFLPEATVVASSAQTDIREYYPGSAADAFEAAFGSREFPGADSDLGPRVNVIDRLMGIERSGMIHLISNSGDKMHVEKHAQPLRKAFERNGRSGEVDFIDINLGQGHKTPDNERYSELMLPIYERLSSSS